MPADALHREEAGYREEAGWVRVDEVLTADEAAGLAGRCASLADELADPGPGDKPFGGTRRLSDLQHRLPETAAVVATLQPVVDQILTGGSRVMEVAWRSPSPGFGAQRLHADDTPRLDNGPDRCATAIVALVDFDGTNGATRVVPGSHLRPDLQRRSGQLEHHPDEIHLVGPAGAAFLFTGHLLHGGSENRSDAPRPAIQIAWQAGSA